MTVLMKEILEEIVRETKRKKYQRLEKLEKVIEILKTKYIYISDFTLNTFITYEDYFNYYIKRRCFSIEEIATEEEYELLKEVLNDRV